MKARSPGLMLSYSYAATIFVSAFLLFQVQPIISKFILPWFGGSPAVWTTAMVFFQTLLFAGYAYAHFSERMLRPRLQCLVHVTLIAAAIMMLPITPAGSWKPTLGDQPTGRILCLLAVCVGLPYFVLSSTGPLVQAWFSRSYPGRSPYRLYSLSNIGSLAALLSYPFLVEPRLDSQIQSQVWTVGFLLFAVMCTFGALEAWRAGRSKSDGAVATSLRRSVENFGEPSWGTRLAWLALPALASLMLLATTNHVCQDVAVMPLLWVVPLSLYLVTFIICFDHDGWYQRKLCAPAALIALCAAAGIDQLITGGSGVRFSFVQELVVHFAALFLLCMLCHGELVRLKPHPKYLTSFYLMISAGGALGGMLVSIVAPRVFSTFFEWKLALVFGCILAAYVALGGRERPGLRRRFAFAVPGLMLLLAGLNCVPYLQEGRAHEKFDVMRNFYGVISVLERDRLSAEQHKFNFYSGRIVHGIQFVAADKRRQPTAYFGHQAGIGQAMATVRKRPELRVGVVGLGIGTLASYARPGDYYRFYEINPNVDVLARRYFSYLGDCRGKLDVVLGDGRLSLEREAPQHFDLLVLDAFSGDAVPTHLLTKEAFEIYRGHLEPGGLIAVNISNRYLNLAPVVRRLAAEFDWAARQVSSQGDPERGLFPAEWMLLDPRQKPSAQAIAAYRQGPLWTDSYSNLFQILR